MSEHNMFISNVRSLNSHARHDVVREFPSILCDRVPETGGHMFLGCTYARELWFRLLDLVGLATLVPGQEDSLGEWWLRQR
jgi:hypothetical protein